jgi:hypothetical protein
LATAVAGRWRSPTPLSAFAGRTGWGGPPPFLDVFSGGARDDRQAMIDDALPLAEHLAGMWTGGPSLTRA